VAYESVDRNTPDGLARWQAAGSPPIPAVEVDGVSTLIMHVSQLAGILGLPAPPMPDATRLAYDLLMVVGSWAAIVSPLPWEIVVAETPSRNRSIRNLTMNAVYPISLLPVARDTGRFDWGLIDEDEQLAARFETTESLAAFVRSVHDEWAAFVVAREDDLTEQDPWTEAPRGRMRYSELLSHQRWHIAFHHRQLIEFLEQAGMSQPAATRINSSLTIKLPRTVF
jgi:hypothetical protein